MLFPWTLLFPKCTHLWVIAAGKLRKVYVVESGPPYLLFHNEHSGDFMWICGRSTPFYLRLLWCSVTPKQISLGAYF